MSGVVRSSSARDRSLFVEAIEKAKMDLSTCEGSEQSTTFGIVAAVVDLLQILSGLFSQDRGSQ